jgi:hypothetical protein
MSLLGYILLPQIQRTKLGCHIPADFASNYGQNNSLHLVPYIVVCGTINLVLFEFGIGPIK